MNKKGIKLWLPLIALAVGVALRLIALDRKSFWLDEAATLNIASFDSAEIVSLEWDPHPPLYYLLMHDWTRLVQGEFLLRLPSALAGAVAIPLLYWLVREWDSRGATTAAWLLALAPLHIWHSQEARMYSLVCTLGLASALCYTLAIRRQTPLLWIPWIVATAAGFYTHYSMILLVAIEIGLFGLVWKANKASGKVLWSALLALLTVALLYIPQMRKLAIYFDKSLWYHLVAQSLLSEWGISISTKTMNLILLLVGIVALGAGPLIVQALLGRLGQTRINTILVPASIAIYIVILIATAIQRGFGVKKQLLIMFPYVLGGIATFATRHRYHSYVVIGMLCATLPLTGYTILVQEQEAWREAAHAIEQLEEAHDSVLISAPYSKMPFDYYYQGGLPTMGVNPSDIPKKLLEITSSHERVWLVLSHNTYTDPEGKIQNWLDNNYTLLGELAFKGVGVRLYDTWEVSE